MKKFFRLAALLSLGLILSQSVFIYASQSMVISPNASSSSKDVNNTSTNSSRSVSEVKKGGINATQDANSGQRPNPNGKGAVNGGETYESPEMAAWMIETSQAAKDFVETIDRGQYTESWTKGDELFKNTITQNEWAQALNGGRKELGAANSRTLRLQRPAWNPRGLPAGPYMVIEYDTTFPNSSKATGELLTLRRGSDNKWRVLTYQVI